MAGLLSVRVLPSLPGPAVAWSKTAYHVCLIPEIKLSSHGFAWTQQCTHAGRRRTSVMPVRADASMSELAPTVATAYGSLLLGGGLFAYTRSSSKGSLLGGLSGGVLVGVEQSSSCYWKQASLRHYATKGRKSKRGVVNSDERVLDEKHAALEDALAQISSTFGKETVMWLGRNVAHRNIPIISTGSLSLDCALGVGGLPKGRVVEIYGPEASGKTTLALHVIAEAQKTGGYCVFIDAEHALDPSFAEALGVRTEDLLLAQPDCGEQALSLTDTFIRSGSIDVIVVDSVAALVPRAELDGDMGDAHMAVQARLMSQALRKLAHSLSKSQTILIFINQIRAKLSTVGFGGPIEVTSGGNALKFYASVRLNIRRTGYIKKGEEVVGSSVTVKVAKNKVAPPFKNAEFEIEFGKGISKEGEIADFAVKYGFINKSGNWYAYNGENIANGKENLKRYLREHTDLKELLLTRIREKLVGGAPDEDESSSNEDATHSEQEFESTVIEEEIEVIAKQ